MARKLSAAMRVAAAVLALSAQVTGATGLATCDSGAQAGWQPQEKLTAMLEGKGWEIRHVKVDGGCYEVYAIDEKGDKVEAYFHPVTLERVPIEGE